VPADLLHFVRHGEVHNPEGILYGRLEGFGLSARGQEMAGRASTVLATRPVERILSSPLQRAVESATPLSVATGVPIDIDERLTEGLNDFQGTTLNLKRIVSDPAVWKMLYNPWRPSWGEPYREIAARMLEVAEDARNSVDKGEVVLVTTKWLFGFFIALLPASPAHLPHHRRCSLSSITTIKKVGENGGKKATGSRQQIFWKTPSIWGLCR